MTRITLYAKCVLALLSLSPTYSYAQENTGQAYFDVGVFSNYMWRGLKLSEKSVVQPSVGVSYNSFSINFWSNYDSETNEHNETDFTFDYAFSYENIEINTGYIYYAVDGPESAETSELYVAMYYDSPLNPTFTLYYDNDEGKGGFAEFGVHQELGFSDNFTFGVGALIGYNLNNSVMGTNNKDEDFNGFYNGDLSIFLPYDISESLSLEAIIGYSFPLSDSAEYAIEQNSVDGDSETIYTGVTLTLSM